MNWPSQRNSIPLLVVFLGQSLLVAAAFAAVIAVLAVQQSTQFEGAVHDRIRLHLQRSSRIVSSPLLARELVNDQLTYRLQNSPDLWFGDNMTIASPNVQRFLNFSYAIATQDPLLSSMNQCWRHSTKRTPEGNPLFGIIGLTAQKLTAVSNYDFNPETVNGGIQTGYPLAFTNSLVGVALPVTTAEWHITQFKALKSEWGRGAIFHNPVTGAISISGGISTPLVIGHYDPLNASSPIGGVLNFAYSLDITFLTDTADDALLSPDSKLLMYDSVSEYIMASRGTSAGTWNTALDTQWVLDTFPDQDLVASFRKYRSQALCTNTTCDVFLDPHVSDSIVTLLQVNTPRGFEMQVFQITPRSYFFAAGTRSIAIGVSIGVVAAVLVLASCIAIWFAVRVPVRRLQVGMDLAAQMRNEEVEDTRSVITEMDTLATAFHFMNRRLLQARAFMPQTLLQGGDDMFADDDAIDEGDLDADGSGTISQNPPNADRSNAPPLSSDTNVDAGMESAKSVISENSSTRVRSEHAKGGISSALRSGLTVRKVGVLIVNARGTHEVCKLGAIALARRATNLVALVETAALGEKGIVDSFQGDHFVVTFNAARAVGTPERNAALAALTIAAADAFKFSMGVSAGKVFVGNVGTATMKKFCTLGPAFTNAAGLEQLAKATNWPVLSHGRCLAESVFTVDHLLLGYGTLASGSEDTVGVIIQPNPRTVGEKDSEWMYVIAGNVATKEDPFSMYNAAFGACLFGDFSLALALRIPSNHASATTHSNRGSAELAVGELSPNEVEMDEAQLIQPLSRSRLSRRSVSSKSSRSLSGLVITQPTAEEHPTPSDVEGANFAKFEPLNTSTAAHGLTTTSQVAFVLGALWQIGVDHQQHETPQPKSKKVVSVHVLELTNKILCATRQRQNMYTLL